MRLSAAEAAYQAIKSRILDQEYTPGFQLKEIQISTELGLTRTPIREAIIRLEREGLATTFPRRGAFVIELSKKEIEDLFDVREALEVKASLLAIRRANREELSKVQEGLDNREKLYQQGIIKDYREPKMDFHWEVMKLSKNERLISIWKTMDTQLSLVRITSSLSDGRYLRALEEHNQILSYIEKGDDAKVEQLVRKHLLSSKNNYLSHLPSGE